MRRTDLAILTSALLALLPAAPAGGSPGVQLLTDAAPSTYIDDLAISADDRWLAAGTDRGGVVIWDVVLGLQYLLLDAHMGDVSGIAFHPGEAWLATVGAEGEVALWDVEAGTEMLRVPVGEGPHGVAFGSDGRELFVLGGRTLSRVDLETREMERLPIRVPRSGEAHLLPGGRLAVLRASELVISDPHSGATRRFPLPPLVGRFSERLIIGGADGSPVVVDDMSIDFQSRSIVRLPFAGLTIRLGSTYVEAAAVSRDGKTLYLAAEQDGERSVKAVMLFDLPSGDHVQTYATGSIPNWFSTLAASPSGRLLAGAGLGGVQILDLVEGAVLHRTPPVGEIQGLTFDHVAPYLYTRDEDDVIRVWDLTDGTLARVVTGVGSMAPHPAGGLVTAGPSFMGRWAPGLAGDPRRGEIASGGSHLNDIAVHPEGGLAIAVKYGAAFALAEDHPVAVSVDLPDLDNWSTRITFSPDGELGAFASRTAKDESTIHVFHARTSAPETSFSIPGDVQDLAFRGGGRQLLVEVLGTHEAGRERHLFRFDSGTGHQIDDLGFARAYAVGPGGHLLAVRPEGIQVVDADGDLVCDLEIPSLKGPGAIDPTGRWVAVADAFSGTRLIDASSCVETVTFQPVGPEGHVTWTPTGQYRASPDAVGRVGMRLRGSVHPARALDLRLNRPDLIARTLGRADEDALASLERAWGRRQVNRGRGHPEDCSTAVQLSTRDPGVLEASHAKISFNSGGDLPLVRAGIDVNGVTAFQADCGGRTRCTQLDVPVTLTPGRNLVEAWAESEDGAVAHSNVVSFQRSGTDTGGRLFLAAIGVADYVDEDLDLEFAAKDAADMSRFFRANDARFDGVDTVELLDGAATREGILDLAAWFARSEPGDVALLYLAGHGLVDEHGEYWFATHDVDVDAPGERGLAYSDLERILEGIPARRRVLLVDTCHAGLRPDDAVALADLPRDVTARSLGRGARVQPRTEERDETLALVRNLFTDLQQHAATVVIGAAGGEEYAFESGTWRNGLFTHVVLDALEHNLADANRDGTTTVSEFQEYVTRKVERLSGGRQRPSARRLNLAHDFPLTRGTIPSGHSLAMAAAKVECLLYIRVPGVRQATITRDGGSLVAAGDLGVRRWRLRPLSETGFVPAMPWVDSPVALAADGDLVAVTNTEDEMEVWSIDRGELLIQQKLHRFGSRLAFFSPDGRFHTLDWGGREWSQEGLELRRTGRRKLGWIERVMASPTGEVDFYQADSSFALYRGTADDLIVTEVPARIKDAAFARDDTLLALVLGDNTVRIHRVSDGEEELAIAELREPSGVAFHPSGLQLAVADGSQVDLYSVEDGQRVRAIELGHTAHGVIFDPTGTLLLVWGDGRVSLWGAPRGTGGSLLFEARATAADGDPTAALALYDRALAEDAAIYGSDAPELLPLWSESAQLLCDVGEATGCLQRLTRVEAIQREFLGGEGPEYAETLQRMASALVGGERMEDALALHHDACELLTPVDGVASPAVLECHVDFAHELLSSGQVDAASEALRKQAPRIDVLAPSESDHRNLWYSLGQALFRAGEYELARENLESLLTHHADLDLKGEVLFADLLYILGMTYKQLELWERARVAFDGELEYRDPERIGIDVNAAITWSALADVLEELGDREGTLEARGLAARGYLEDEPGLAEPGSSAADWELDGADELVAAAALRKEMGDANGAADDLQRAIAILDWHGRTGFQDLSGPLWDLGRLCWDLGDLDGAEAALERELALCDVHFGEPDHGHGISLFNLARFHSSERQDHETAAAYLIRSLEIFDALEASLEDDVAPLLEDLADAQAEIGGHVEAAKTLRRLLAVQEEIGAPQSEAEWALYRLGRALEAQGQLAEAREVFEEELRLVEARLGPDHESTLQSVDNLRELAEELGDVEAATALAERAYQAGVRIGDRDGTAEQLMHLGELTSSTPDGESRRAYVERRVALGPDDDLEVDHDYIEALLELGVAEISEDGRSARRHLRQYVQLASAAPEFEPWLIGGARILLAGTLAELSDTAGAIRTAREGRDALLGSESVEPGFRVTMLDLCIYVFELAGAPEEALNTYRLLDPHLVESGSPDAVWANRYTIARLEIETGLFERALQTLGGLGYAGGEVDDEVAEASATVEGHAIFLALVARAQEGAGQLDALEATLGTLVEACLEADDPDGALNAVRNAEASARERGDLIGVVRRLVTQVEIHALRGDLIAAEAALARATSAADLCDDPMGPVLLDIGRAEFAQARGELATAFHHYRATTSAGLVLEPALGLNLADRWFTAALTAGDREEALAALRTARDIPGANTETIDGLLTRLAHPDEVGGTGALVTEVLADSNALEAGIHTGDVIVRYDGQDVGPAQLTDLVPPTEGRSAIDLVVLRGDRRLEITVPGGQLGVRYRNLP